MTIRKEGRKPSFFLSFACVPRTKMQNPASASPLTTGSLHLQPCSDARLASMNILNVDKNGAVYVDIYEMEDSSIVTGAYTVKQYINGKCKKITSVDLKSYYFMPNRVICVSEEGDLYQMICRKDNITIIKKV